MPRHDFEDELRGDMHRDLGRLEARANSQDDRLERIEDKVDQLVEFMQGARGSWKALVAVGALASSLTLIVNKILAALIR